jgi:hypothetical protein
MTAVVSVEPPIPALLDALRATTPSDADASLGAAPTLLGRAHSKWCELTRRELLLPTDRPIVASGHQAAFWHPGIVAKSFLAQILAEAVGGATAHVVVEQDTEPVATLAVPIRDDHGVLRRTSIELCRAPNDVVAGMIPAFDPPPTPQRFALPSVDEGLAAIHTALRGRRAELNAALQVTAAAFDLLHPLLPAPRLLRPRELLRTTFAAALLEQLARDPQDAATAYNRAVSGTRDAATLAIHDDRVEIPLWRLDAEGRRLRAWDDDLARFAAGEVELLPRALLMTGLLRVVCCDLFVHGVGGAAYDTSMERWFAEWLGASVAPSAMATATLLLPFPESESPRAAVAAEIRRWREGYFDPERLDSPLRESPFGKELVSRTNSVPRVDSGGGPGPEKQVLLQAIAALPRRTLERRAAWRAVHERLEALRQERAPSLDARRDALDAAIRDSRQGQILDDRTWAFPFHPVHSLAALRDSLR